MREELEKLAGRWIRRRNEMQERCPSSCHGEIDALNEVIDDILVFLDDEMEAGG